MDISQASYHHNGTPHHFSEAAASSSSSNGASNNNNSSHLLSLKVRFVDSNIIKTLQFDPTTLVFDVLRIIREKIPETSSTNAQNYGIFISNSDGGDSSKGTWLESNRTLEYYLLKNADTIDYKNKFRKLCIKLLDGQTKTLMVDDSQTVGQLMIFICSKMSIANYEEYSLIHEGQQQLSEKERTQTLKKDKTLNRDHKKMEELKRKLHTDDDIAWLDHSKTLRQQNVDETSCLILKRKLFFSDKNVDTRDPVQLNLLYVQCRDGILNGTHPINEEEAIKFAAIQCQIKFGNYVDAYKSGFLELKEYLPKEYVKQKGIEKKIFHEWKQVSGANELDGRLKYIQLCRSLKTYGVTFFLVKEKMDGKNKLITRLLGISKESIIRVDEKSKEFLHVYPLECVKKWAASPNTFTLDFGDHYKDPYFSMQTTEGEHIARLISGYIDIILKKKKAKEFVGNEAYEETPMLEEVVSPSKATVIQINKTNINQSVTGNVILPGVLRNSQQQQQEGAGGGNQSIPITVNNNEDNDTAASKLVQLQKPLVTTIENARAVISNVQSNLNQKIVLVDVGNDPASIQWRVNMLDVNKQNATSHLSAMNAATAQVVTLTSSGQQQSTDYNAVGAAVSTISTNLGDFSKDVMMLAALQQQQPLNQDNANNSDNVGNSRLLGAARKLCSTFGDFLRYVEPECKEPRQNLFSAVSRIGEAGNEFMHSINQDDYDNNSDDQRRHSINHHDQTQSYRLQEIIIGMAKMVASSTAGLVIASKHVANHCSNQQGVNEVIALVTQCALSTSQLVSCTKVCSSTIGSRECQDQIVEAAKQVQRQVRLVVDVARQNCQNDHALEELSSCASNVSGAVNQLLDNVSASNERIVNNILIASANNNGNSSSMDNRDTGSSFYAGQSQAIERIYNATDRLFESMNDPPEMIKQAKILAQATTELVNLLKQEAHVQSTNEKQKKLLMAAKLLAEATARIVESAKGCAADPRDEVAKNNLRRSVDELKKATGGTIMTSNDDVFDQQQQHHSTSSPEFKLIKQLELSAKQAASCATQAIAAIQVCILHAEGEQQQQQQQSRQSTHLVQQQLIQQCKVVADHVPKIVQGIRACMVQPRGSKSAHLSLISASEDFLMPVYKMISLTKTVLPTIVNEIKTIQLRNCTNQLINALSDLKNCLAKTEQVCGSFESDGMIESIRMLETELNSIYSSSAAGTLRPLPGESLDACEAELAHISKSVGSTMAQMISAAAQGNEVNTGLSAKETLNSLRSFTSCIRAIVACKMTMVGNNNSSSSSSSSAVQCQKLIESAHQVLDQACTLVLESKQALFDINSSSGSGGGDNANSSSSSQQRLTQIARVIVQSLYDCVNCLSTGHNKDNANDDLDQVIKRMCKVTSILLSIEEGDVLNAGREYDKTTSELENDLNQTACALNQSANQLVIEVNQKLSSQRLGHLANSLADTFDLFLQLSLALVGLRVVESGDEREKQVGEMLRGLKDLHTMCSKLLHAVVKSTGQQQRQQLSTSVKQLTESLNAMLTLLNTNDTTTMLRECENGLRSIETTRTILNVNIQQGVVDGPRGGGGGVVVINEPPTLTNTLQSYYDCLDFIIDQSRVLGESITGLANSCKTRGMDSSNSSSPIRETSNALCELVESAMHSAYIIGASDVESQPGQPPLLDTAHFSACAQHIHDTCAYLLDYVLLGRGNESSIEQPELIQKQLIQCATQIAHSTASLCTASQHASNKTSNMLAKRHFVQSAKQVANATANFVKAIKSVQVADLKENGVLIDQLSNLMRQLADSVDSLCQYALSPEFLGTQATLSPSGVQAQQPIVSAARIILDSGAHLIQASKSLLVSNSDPQMWQQFSSNSKLISESIKKLATSIKEKAPAKVECDQALAQLEKCLKMVESALIALAMNQDIDVSSSVESHHREQAISCATQISELVDQLRQAAKCEADRLAHLVTEIAQYFQPFVINVIQCAATASRLTTTESTSIQKQTLLLEQCKTVVESMLQLLIASKENAGNPKQSREGSSGTNNSLHQAIDENADGTKEVIEDLIQTLEEQVDPTRRSTNDLASGIRNIELTATGDDREEEEEVSDRMSEEQKEQVFREYEIKIKQITFTLQQILQEMPGAVSRPADELGHHAQQLTQTYNCLILACKGYIHNAWLNHESSTESNQSNINRITNQSARIKSIAQDLGKSCIDLIQLTGQLTNSNLNSCNGGVLEEEEINSNKTELIRQCSSVNDCAQQLINSFNQVDDHHHVSRVFVPNPSQGGGVTTTGGESACHSAEQAINGILADLNTVCMFASAGTLKSDFNSNEDQQQQVDSFGNHRESVLRSAKTLVEDTKALVSASGSPHGVDQPTLARCIQTSVRTIGRLADSVKLAAASLGSEQSDTQIMVLNAVRDVAASLQDLVVTIKVLVVRQDDDDSTNSESSTNMLSDSAKNMITNVQSLLKTIKAVEDEAQRGTRALEAAVDAIYQEIRQYSMYLNNSSSTNHHHHLRSSTTNGNRENVMPEDLIKATRQITLATSKAIGAGNSLRQEDVIVAANMGRKAVSDLLYVCYHVLTTDDQHPDQQSQEERKNIITAGLNCAIFYKELLDSILNAFNKSSESSSSTITVNKQNLIVYSKNVAGAVTDIIKIAESLRSTADGWVDPEDPTSVAESELLGAADAIDSAAKKLSRLKPRTKTETLNENLNFDEQILEFAKSITNAAGALISSATDAQKELVAQGKLKPVSAKYNEEDDGQWSQGLISAARLVAAACHTLCEAANGLVQGHGTEERLISSAKQVASSTAALLVACQVKSDKQSQSMKRLQNAGNAVKRATDALVRSAQQASDASHEEAKYLELNTKFVGSMAQEIMLREEILRKERELKAAQAAYNAVKKARYQREENSPTSSTGGGGGSCSNSSSSNNIQSSTINTNNN